MQVYHYAGNNPVKYTDPDGEIFGVDDVVEGVAIGALFIGITAYMATGSYQKVNAAVGAASEGLNTVREEMNALGNKIKASFAKNTSDLPSQGKVDGGVDGAPLVDAGRQGKHVPGHNNNDDPSKSDWPKGSTGVKETQEAWLNGTKLPDGTKVWDSGKKVGQNGETGVRVHSDKQGNIHGYPVDIDVYKDYLNKTED